ncbi:MAG: carboxylating nicotinate-nucleotide diphosphorylase [Nitrospirota bacterium]
MIIDLNIEKLIRDALAEDIGSGDVTIDATIPLESTSTAVMLAKQDLALAGLDVAGAVFHSLDSTIRFEPLKKDGDRITKGSEIARLSGNTRVLLMGERVALNFVQHLSGIATLTAQYVERVKDLPVKILDTRKTTPGLRTLEKYAVRMGGGTNHRFGLFDGVLIKDNHIKAAGSITHAVNKAGNRAHHLLNIEVETKNLDEAQEAISAKADIIMLDNMPLDMMREAVRLIAKRALIEASGNVTLDTVRSIAETGVDFISCGSLTHSAPAVDISLKIK